MTGPRIRVRSSSWRRGLHTLDAIELAACLCTGAIHAGATFLNLMTVDDVCIHGGRVAGVVVNRTRIGDSLPVDPIVCASAEEVFNLTLNGTANAINSVHANGGPVRYFAMDEPIRRWYPEYYYLVTGQTDPRPCLVESLDTLADHVAAYVLFMHDALPSLSIGQIALYPEVGVATLMEWVLALEERGVALPFLQSMNAG